MAPGVPPDLIARPGGAATGGAQGSAAQVGAAAPGNAPPAADTGAGTASRGSAAVADRVDIQPLELAAALQILLAEAALELGHSVPAAASVPAPQAPGQAARMLLQLFVDAAPADGLAPDQWEQAAVRLETACAAAIERAVAVVAGWRDVAPAVVAAARSTQLLVAQQLAAAPVSVSWLRPEWAGLAPRLQAFRRRRARARARLSDGAPWPPDLDSSIPDSAAPAERGLPTAVPRKPA